MPRGPRLDAPGALHHVIGRGIERRAVFVDDDDREDFLDRLTALVEQSMLTLYAWALMPNHFHLLARTGVRPLERAMRSLLAGYATRFNRRHERAGHLFQNRYKSTLCEDEPYFLRLVHYIHLNPVPSVVPDLRCLRTYAYSGHSALLGRMHRPWQDTEAVLRRFGEHTGEARIAYERSIAQAAVGPQADLEGGGFTRSAGDWKYVDTLRKGRERHSSDERILGTPDFVDRALEELRESHRARVDQSAVIDLVCRALGIEADALTGDGRSPLVTRARRGIAYLWTIVLGGSGRAIARRLGLNPASIYEAAERGRREAGYWSSFLRPDEPGKP